MALESDNDTFTINFTNHMKLIDNKDNNNLIDTNHRTTEEQHLNYKNNLEAFEKIEIILNDNYDHNENEVKNASEDILPEFESTEEIESLTAQDLIIKEVLEDILLQTFKIEDKSRLRPDVDNSSGDDDENPENIPRVRRCSSLKTGKTPPGTPSCKKIVRFADVLGLDLADVRTYLDDIPKVPVSAFKDLSNCDFDPTTVCPTTRNLIALFQQPVTLPTFLGKVTLNMIAVENAYVEDPISFCMKGAIRVRNLAFHKFVSVRYTMDKWRKTSEVQATYVKGSSDGFTDRFEFTLFAYALDIGEKLEFAARYQVNGQQYWDNNNGNNFCFQCLPVEAPQSEPMTAGIKEQFTTFYYDEIQSGTDEEILQNAESGKIYGSAMNMEQLSSADVQKYIARTLIDKDKMASCGTSCNKPEVLLFFGIVFLSIVVMYFRKIFY